MSGERGGYVPRVRGMWVCDLRGSAYPSTSPPDMGYNGIRSRSGWYASYWNAFLFYPVAIILFIAIRITDRMDASPILFIIHTVIIGTMLNSNDGKNGDGLKRYM